MIRLLAVLVLLLAGSPAGASPSDPDTPDVTVLDQNGAAHRFRADLLAGRTVAIDFFYTSCRRFCRPLSANLREVQDRLAGRMGKDIALISVSIDPGVDTPARLKAFATAMDAGPGWIFVTGARPDIAGLLRQLGQTLGDPADHMPLVLVHRDGSGEWTHVDGYDPRSVAATLLAAAGPPPAASADPAAAARAYMTNPTVVTQDGRRLRLFDDLLDGRVALINFMMTGCTSVCPAETANLARVQDLLGDRLGKSVVMLSLSVDPRHDTPERLKRFADRFGARPGWYFLTGDPGDMDRLERRLGGYTTDPADHSSVVIAGNAASGSWIKLLALDDPSAMVRHVLGLATPAPR